MARIAHLIGGIAVDISGHVHIPSIIWRLAAQASGLAVKPIVIQRRFPKSETIHMAFDRAF